MIDSAETNGIFQIAEQNKAAWIKLSLMQQLKSVHVCFFFVMRYYCFFCDSKKSFCYTSFFWCNKNEVNPCNSDIYSTILFCSYPDYEFLNNFEATILAEEKMNRIEKDSLLGLLVDIHLLSKCDHLVCDGNSNVSVNILASATPGFFKVF